MGALLRVFIVRHGETAANVDGMIQGQLDTELNEEGLRQAGLLAGRMEGVPIGVAFTSDLSRAKKTAQVVLEKHPGIALHECRELRERFMGTLQGTKLPAIARKAILQQDKTIETTAEFAERVIEWWKGSILPLAQKVLGDLSKEGTSGGEVPDEDSRVLNVLAASHGGTISTFFNAGIEQGLLHLGKGVWMTRCWNTSVSVIEVDCETLKGKVVMYGDISHLLSKPVVRTNVDEVEVDFSPDFGGEESKGKSVKVVWKAEADDSRPQSRNGS